eukprot:m.52598 g.52598  ORF g.52598 m.52598 type:complete len:872 (-) comp12311_c0_seq1:133-2748(-)
MSQDPVSSDDAMIVLDNFAAAGPGGGHHGDSDDDADSLRSFEVLFDDELPTTPNGGRASGGGLRARLGSLSGRPRTSSWFALKSTVDRPIFNETAFFARFHEELREDDEDSSTTCMEICKGIKLPRFSIYSIFSLFFITTWLPSYDWRTMLVGDLAAGLTLGVMVIPQGLAYGLLAKLPPIYGLYTSFMPAIVYPIFGMSRELSMGTFALTSLMVGQAVSRFVDDAENPSEEEQQKMIDVAVSLSFVVGVLQMILFILRFGGLTVFLPPVFTSAYTTASAFHIAGSQLKHVFGLEFERYTGPGSLFRTYYTVLKKLPDTNAAAFVTAILAMFILYWAKYFSTGGLIRVKNLFKKGQVVFDPPCKERALRFPIPGELIVVVLGTLTSYLADFESTYDVKIVGDIPSGLPSPGFPNSISDVLSEGLSDVIVLTIVGYAVSVSIASSFATQFAYDVDANQELFAIGATNVLSSFFQSYVSAGSLSRSALAASIGSSSQLFSLISVLVVMLVMLFLASAFTSLPNAILAAVILMALRGLFRQLSHFKYYWHVKKSDFFIWIVTFIGVLALGVDYGLGVGVAVSLVVVLYSSARPYSCLLGQVPGTELYRDITRSFAEVREVDKVKIFRYNASLYFANLEHFTNTLYKNTIHPFAEEESDFHTVILDMSTCNDIDSAGVNKLVIISNDFANRKKVRLLLAHVRGPVRDVFTSAKFYKHVGKQNLFVSVHDAVLYAEVHADKPNYLLEDPDVDAILAQHQALLAANKEPEEPVQLDESHGRARTPDGLLDTSSRRSRTPEDFLTTGGSDPGTPGSRTRGRSPRAVRAGRTVGHPSPLGFGFANPTVQVNDADDTAIGRSSPQGADASATFVGFTSDV